MTKVQKEIVILFEALLRAESALAKSDLYFLKIDHS